MTPKPPPDEAYEVKARELMRDLASAQQYGVDVLDNMFDMVMRDPRLAECTVRSVLHAVGRALIAKKLGQPARQLFAMVEDPETPAKYLVRVEDAERGGVSFEGVGDGSE